MDQLKILLSFDHELGLGGATSYARNLFGPTDRLMDLADELETPITLFTDVCCSIRFRDWDNDGFFRPYKKQIERACYEGHDVQLHLHPHWIDSDYRNGRFIPAKSYSLGAFQKRKWPNNIPGIISQGIEFLNELCCHQSEYRCIAYRAGGFSLTPATSTILSELYDQGIRIESSVAKGYQFACQLWSVDFQDMPASANWYIAKSGPVNRTASNGLYEIPIATRPRTPLNNVPFLFQRVLRRYRRYRSGGWSIDVGATSLATKLKRLYPRSAWMLGFDNHTDSVNDLMKTLHYHIERHSEDEMIACSVISHPKFMGEHARALMKDFVERVRAEYGNQVSFCSYRQFYDEHLPSQDEEATNAKQSSRNEAPS